MSSAKTEITWSDVEKIIKKVVKKSRTREMKEMAKAIESLATYMKEGFEEFNKRFEEFNKRFEEFNKRFESMEACLRDLRLEVSALGERFGYGFEDVVMKTIAEVKGLRISKASKLSLMDEKGEVFGIPAEIRFDVYLSDDEKILVEVKSRCRLDDVLKFYRKTIYAEKTLKEKFKMIIIAVAFDKEAYDKCRELGVETIARSIIM
ncbi:MAG: DUF3782 domain-containing protein [Candidatus Methanomethylicia archaeon]